MGTLQRHPLVAYLSVMTAIGKGEARLATRSHGPSEGTASMRWSPPSGCVSSNAVNTLTSTFLENHAINDVVTALQNVSSVAAYTTYGVYQSYVFRGFSDSVMMVDGVRSEGGGDEPAQSRVVNS